MRVAATLVPLALVAIGTASAAPRPVSPADGAIVRSAHPILRWELPANERSEEISVASKPDTTPEGRFFSENVVTSDFFLSTQDPREWAPTSALYAGRYWWIVGSEERECCQSYLSTPVGFTIPAEARIVGLRIRRQNYFFLPDELDVDVYWRTNVERPIAEVSVTTFRGRRLWLARKTEFGSVGRVGSSSFAWSRPRRVRTGTRVRLRVRLSAGGANASVTRIVKAP